MPSYKTSNAGAGTADAQFLGGDFLDYLNTRPGGPMGGGGKTYSTGGAAPPPPYTGSSQRNPDYDRVGRTAERWYRGVDPETQRRQQMAAARELGVGMSAEARANEARRGVSGTGVTAFNDRKIAQTVMREANKAGLDAANRAQEMQLGGINAMTGIAGGQASTQAADLDRMMAQWNMRHQQQMAEQQLKLQQLQLAMQMANQGLGAGAAPTGGGTRTIGSGASMRGGGMFGSFGRAPGKIAPTYRR